MKLYFVVEETEVGNVKDVRLHTDRASAYDDAQECEYGVTIVGKEVNLGSLIGSIPSDRRVEAARRNGLKGGRPKKKAV
jgi:hypothetical protein